MSGIAASAWHSPKAPWTARRARLFSLPTTPPPHATQAEGVRRQPWLAPLVVSTMLAATVAIALAGCQPSDESQSARTSAVDPADGLTQSGAAATVGTTPGPPSGEAEDFTLLIEAQRVTDLADIEALQTSAEDYLPPLLLTVELQRAPLRAVLRELARKLQIKVTIADGVPERRISLRLDDMPVVDAIGRILGDIPHQLVYRDAPTSEGASGQRTSTAHAPLVELRVFVPNQGMASQAGALKPLMVKPPRDQVEAWKKQALEGREPKQRLTALKQILEQPDPAEHESVLYAALRDTAPEIRILAINSIDSDFNPPLESISDLALNDESPQVRTTAVGVLLSRYGAAALPTFEQALADPDPSVQRTARSALEMTQRLNALFPRLAR